MVIDNGVIIGIFCKMDIVFVICLLINFMLLISYMLRLLDSLEKMLDEIMNIFLYGIMNDGGE